MLTEQEKLYYARQIALKSFGQKKQERLKKSRVLLVGAGGIGCPLSLYLVSTGLGELTIVDDDQVALSNLHRQVAYSTEEVGQKKADVLARHLRLLNPNSKISSWKERVIQSNVQELIDGVDLVIDGSDNFESRYLLADACYHARTPLLHVSVSENLAHIALISLGSGHCYRCIFPSSNGCGGALSCVEAGVLGVMTGTAGLLGASEAVKFLAGERPNSERSLLVYDQKRQEIRHLQVSRDPACLVCYSRGQQMSLIRSTATSLDVSTVSCERASQLLAQGALLIDVREPGEFETSHLRGAINIPASQIVDSEPGGAESELLAAARKSTLVLYCQTGKRSLAAAQNLKIKGFSHVFSLEGGYKLVTAIENKSAGQKAPLTTSISSENPAAYSVPKNL